MGRIQLDTGDDGPDTWQERIVQWRFEASSVPKRIAGFWLKAGIEMGVVVGVPVGLFVLAATTLGNVTLSSLPIGQLGRQSILVTWILLSVLAWTPLRCLLTDELQFVTQT